MWGCEEAHLHGLLKGDLSEAGACDLLLSTCSLEGEFAFWVSHLNDSFDPDAFDFDRLVFTNWAMSQGSAHTITSSSTLVLKDLEGVRLRGGSPPRAFGGRSIRRERVSLAAINM